MLQQIWCDKWNLLFGIHCDRRETKFAGDGGIYRRELTGIWIFVGELKTRKESVEIWGGEIGFPFFVLSNTIYFSFPFYLFRLIYLFYVYVIYIYLFSFLFFFFFSFSFKFYFLLFHVQIKCYFSNIKITIEITYFPFLDSYNATKHFSALPSLLEFLAGSLRTELI